MVQSNQKQKNSDGTMRQLPDFIKAAENGDISEGLKALRDDPDCIYQTHKHTGMNGVQVSIAQAQDNFTKFVLNNTKISVRHKDFLERDGFDVALHCLASDEIFKLVENRWYEELQKEISLKESKVVSISPRTPKL